MTPISTYARTALALILGERCVVCGHPRAGADVCPKCLLELPYINIRGVADAIIERIFWGILPIERAASMLIYEPGNNVQAILKSIKYRGRSDLAVEMGRMMGVEFSRRGFFDGIDCIQPVPLHPNRLNKRGFNQSERLAQGIAEITHLPIVDLVRRQVDNTSQTSLTHAERSNNVKNIFAARTEELQRLRPRHVLFVDDVITTGATVVSCAQTLTGTPDDRHKSIMELYETETAMSPSNVAEAASKLKVSILSLAFAGRFNIGHQTPEELHHPLHIESNKYFRNLQVPQHPI